MLCKVIFAISDFLVFIKNINIDPSTTTEWTLSIQTNCSTVATQYAQKAKEDIRVDPEEVSTLVAEVRFTSSWYSLWRASEGGQP